MTETKSPVLQYYEIVEKRLEESEKKVKVFRNRFFMSVGAGVLGSLGWKMGTSLPELVGSGVVLATGVMASSHYLGAQIFNQRTLNESKKSLEAIPEIMTHEDKFMVKLKQQMKDNSLNAISDMREKFDQKDFSFNEFNPIDRAKQPRGINQKKRNFK